MNTKTRGSAGLPAIGRGLPDQPGADLARSVGLLFLLAPVVAVGAILAQRATGENWQILIPLIGAAWAIGLLMISGRLDSLSPNFFLATTLVGNVLLTLGIYFVGASDFGIVFLYLWEIPFAFHFFRFRTGLLLVIFTALCYGALTITQHLYGHNVPLRSGRWFSLVATGVLLGYSVHQLSQAARRSQQRFHSIFEHGSFGMVLSAEDGRVLEVNPEFERLLGRNASEVKGHRLHEYVQPDDFDKFVAAVQAFQAGSTGQGWHFESRMVDSDGSNREVAISASGIREASGKFTGYVITVEELTERRRAQRAEAENQAKSRFLALMSHELRTPLNAVLGFSQLLERKDFGPLNDKQLRYVSNIRTAGQNLLTLVNDLLDFSKVSADRMDFHVESVNVQELVEEAVGSMRPSADDKQLRLEFTVEPGLTAYADKFRLQQVLLNLLSNGIKFTNSGTVTVKAISEGDKACIAVIDTGIGISADQLPRLFYEFSQLDSGAARTQQGTGLGLALSKRLVFGMAGTIQVESTDGAGSTFKVLIPRAGPTSE
jgi:PAS domain S-box-containing protein